MDQLFKYFRISLIWMFIGFIFGKLFIPEALANFMLIVFFVFMLGLLIISLVSKNWRKRDHIRFSMNYVYLFTFIEGIIFYPSFSYYLADLGLILFLNIVLGAFVYFWILSIYTKKQKIGIYSSWSNYLFIGLIVLILLTIINLFLGIPLLWTLFSIFGFVLFSLYVLFDIDQFKQEERLGLIRDRDDYSIHVLNLFIDFINILLDLLRIASDLK